MARPSARLGARRRDEAPRDLRVVVAEPRLDRELGSLAPQSGSDTASGSPTTSIQQPRAMARYAPDVLEAVGRPRRHEHEGVGRGIEDLLVRPEAEVTFEHVPHLVLVSLPR